MEAHNDTSVKRVQVCLSQQEKLRLLEIDLILSCSYDNRQGTVVCNGGKRQQMLLNANYNTHPIALRGHSTPQAGALQRRMTSLNSLAQVHNAITERCKHSSYATIAKQLMCDGYICNPCAIGASLELTDSTHLVDHVQYKPPKVVASVDIITVDATHRDVLRYCTSRGARGISEVDGSRFQIHSELCQQMNISYHGIMKGHIKGPNYKFMASANELMYKIDWHASFPRGEHYLELTLMYKVQVAAIKIPLSIAKKLVFQFDVIDPLMYIQRLHRSAYYIGWRP